MISHSRLVSILSLRMTSLENQRKLRMWFMLHLRLIRVWRLSRILCLKLSMLPSRILKAKSCLPIARKTQNLLQQLKVLDLQSPSKLQVVTLLMVSPPSRTSVTSVRKLSTSSAHLPCLRPSLLTTWLVMYYNREFKLFITALALSKDLNHLVKMKVQKSKVMLRFVQSPALMLYLSH
jgi:hypothetical protein